MGIPTSTDTSQFSPFDGTDNRKLKTPFSQITIMTSDKKNSIDLPAQLMRLVSKIEITEVYDVGCFHPLTIAITFSEGSREPFPLNNNNDSNVNSLYSLGSGNNGQLTNLIGMLTDLRFQGDGSSITALTQSLEAQSAQTVQGYVAASSSTNQLTDPVQVVNDPSLQNSSNYLFKQGNIVKVTWGYLDDNGGQSKRTVAGILTIMQADYPDNDQPSLNITCQPLTSVFDQITPLKAVPFSSNNPLNSIAPKTFTDMPVPKVIQTIANMCGITQVIISQDVLAPILDERHIKIWHANQSLHEYLSELARRSLSFYTVILNSDNEYVLVFLSRSDMEKQVKLNAIGTNLFAYKQPGSILKSISVKAAFETITTTTFTGLDITGKNTYYSSYHGGKGQVTYANSADTHTFAPTTVDSDNNSVSVAIADSLPGSTFSGIVSIQPTADNPTAMSEGSSAHAGCTNKILSLEFTSIGFHLLKAGEPVLVSNIGERFSTVYRVQEVVHILDSEGYSCHGNLRSALYAAHGNSTEKTQAGDLPDQSDVDLFNPLQASVTSPKDQYDSIVLG